VAAVEQRLAVVCGALLLRRRHTPWLVEHAARASRQSAICARRDGGARIANPHLARLAKLQPDPRRRPASQERSVAVVKGYSIPLSPLGQANLAGDPPWHYSSEILAAEFWVNRQAAQATLPPNVIADGDDAVRAVIMYLDWQFTASNEEMLDPARYQYRETFILLDAHWHDLAITYCPYIYVDNDAALMRGMVQGYPKKLGSVFQTRSFAAPSPAAAPMKEGTKFGASLSAHGERLADIRVTLRDAIADPTTVFNRPTVMRRYFPRLEAGAHHRPAVDQLTLSLTDNLHLVDLWAGDAEVRIPEVRGEELHALAPIRTGRGFRFGMSYSVTDLRILEDYAA
jgi:Acetoacetate decarboxylase (ADC)